MAEKQNFVWLNIPPVWTLGAILFVWAISKVEPSWATFGNNRISGTLAGIFALAGATLLFSAAFVMYKHKTTINPLGTPTHLVTSGPFRFSRNPIYLADLLFVAAAICAWDAPFGIVALVALQQVLSKRFIRNEEAALKHLAPEAFKDYASGTRRWI